MAQTFKSLITIDGDLNAAQAAAPVVNTKKKYTIKLPHPWDAIRYENVVLGLLRRVDGTGVGNVVLTHLRRRLTIRPFIWSPDDNAFTIPAAGAAATEEGRRINPADPKSTELGTGTGSDVTIWIKPANRLIPDATLLHEIVHALRMMEGRRNGFAYVADFGKEEEYHAILIANIFMSELGRTLIRISHKSAAQSWVDLTSPWDQFRIDPFLILQFEMAHSTLASDIGRRSKAAFNPFSTRFNDKLRVSAN